MSSPLRKSDTHVHRMGDKPARSGYEAPRITGQLLSPMVGAAVSETTMPFATPSHDVAETAPPESPPKITAAEEAPEI